MSEPSIAILKSDANYAAAIIQACLADPQFYKVLQNNENNIAVIYRDQVAEADTQVSILENFISAVNGTRFPNPNELLGRIADIIFETTAFSPGLEDLCVDSEMEGEFGRSAKDMIADLREFVSLYRTNK